MVRKLLVLVLSQPSAPSLVPVSKLVALKMSLPRLRIAHGERAVVGVVVFEYIISYIISVCRRWH